MTNTQNKEIRDFASLDEIAESVSELDEPELVRCEQMIHYVTGAERCPHTFYLVPEREYPRLCMDHAQLYKDIATIGGRR